MPHDTPDFLHQTPHNIVRPAPAPASPRRRRGHPRFAVPARRRKALRDESGAALVEFALILPFVMLIVVVFLDFGRAINYWVDTTHLASEGARLAAVDHVPSGSGSLQAYIRGKADTPELKDGGSGSVADPLQVCVNPDGEDVGDPVEVEVKTTYRWIPLLGLDAVQTQIGGRATMRRERVPENVSSGCE